MTNTRRSRASVAIAVFGAMGVVLAGLGVALPNTALFVIGALFAVAAVTALVYRWTDREVLAALVALVLALGLLGTPGLVRSVSMNSGVAWTLDVASENVVVAYGNIYVFESSLNPRERTAQLLDPANGAVLQRWTYDSLARPAITVDGGVIFGDRERDYVGDESREGAMTTFAHFDAAGELLWEAKIEHSSHTRAYVTAADAGAAHITVCDPEEPCRLITIDAAGQIVDERAIGEEWIDRSRDQWHQLDGKGIPRVTLVTDGETENLAFSPSTIDPIAVFPLGDGGSYYGDVRILSDALVTTEHPHDGECRVVGRSLETGEQLWVSEPGCGDELQTLRLGGTGDQEGSLYVYGKGRSDSVPLTFVDAETGALEEIPASAYERYENDFFLYREESLANDVTAGSNIVTAEDGNVRVYRIDDGSVVEFAMPGTAYIPANASGDTMAVVSFAQRGQSPLHVAHNPYLASGWFDAKSYDRPSLLSVIDLATGEVRSTTAFAPEGMLEPIVLPTGQVVVVAGDNRIVVTDPPR